MRVWESWPRFRISRMALSLWRGRARGVYQDFRGQFLASKRGSTLESVEALTEQGDDAQGADPSTLPTSPRCTAIAPESLSASAAISTTRQPASRALCRRIRSTALCRGAPCSPVDMRSMKMSTFFSGQA